MNRFRAMLPALMIAAVALLAAACDNPFSSSDSGTETITIVQSGIARADGDGQITCEDSSKTEPAGHLSSITFTLRASNGLAVESRSIVNPESSTRRQVTFTGIAPGTYNVEHVVSDDHGGSVGQTYRNIRVF